MLRVVLSLLLSLNFFAESFEDGLFLGCYKDIPRYRHNTIKGSIPFKQCIDICQNKYYRYVFVKQEINCVCSNYLGDLKNETHCQDYCKGCELETELADGYKTGIIINGPPRNLIIENITDTQAHLSWEEPESYLEIEYYKVTANALYTYSQTKLVNLVWMHSNNTFRVELTTLHPATHYNITVQAVSSSENDGAPLSKQFETKIGEPDQVPSEPEIIEQVDRTMKIKIKPVTNTNGPISSYLIIVINTDSVQAVQTENLKSYRQANAEGYSYYITAEIQPDRVDKVFVIGDGNVYGKYYNAPLEKGGTYHVMLGAVSRSRDSEKRVFSPTTAVQNDVVVLEMSNDGSEDSHVLIIILSVAIVLISLLLVAGLIGFYFLRNHVHHRHRQRLNDNQELTLQGPIIDIENSGYIHEDEGNSSHYENLNEQVWIIPRNLLNIDHTNLLGIGKFGRVHSGTVVKDEVLVPAGVYSIADRKLNHEDKRTMLRDLDILIKSKRHKNVLDLIGTCESMETICVVLEYSSVNLKELLLNSRILTCNRFTNLSESQAIDFAIDISKGMDYLHSQKILHKQLCSLHIAIVNSNTAKVSGFGLAKYYKTDHNPDFTRFTAKEIFRGQQHVTKSDVWAFACILWEISALGGTPYGNISSQDLPEKVVRGLRLAQLPYTYDSLYQIMLNCWQLDLDERPTFAELTESLVQVKHEQYLNFTLYEGFQYEPYYLELDMLKGSDY